MRLRLKFPLEALATMRVAYNGRRTGTKFSDCNLSWAVRFLALYLCGDFGVLIWGNWQLFRSSSFGGISAF